MWWFCEWFTSLPGLHDYKGDWTIYQSILYKLTCFKVYNVYMFWLLTKYSGDKETVYQYRYVKMERIIERKRIENTVPVNL